MVGRVAKSTLGALLRSLFGQFQKWCSPKFGPFSRELSSSCWSSSRGSGRSKTFFLSVAQAASRQGHDHHRRRPKADHEVRDAASHGRGGKEAEHGHGSRVDGPVRQDNQKHAALGVVEHPHEGYGDRHRPDDKQGDVKGAAVRRVPAGDEKKGQVPQGPEDPKDEAPDKRPVKPLQPGQRKPAPSYLFEDRSPGKKKNGAGHHVQKQRGGHGRRLKGGQGPRQKKRGKYHDRGDAQEDDEVPPKAHPPQHDPAQQAEYALPPPDHTRHDKRGEGRSHYQGDGVQVVRYALTVIGQEAYALF